MVDIGSYNTLTIVKKVDFGLYLDGGDSGEILIPTRYVPEDVKEGDDLEVFIYLDSEDRIIATTEKPFVTVNEFAFLKVAAVTEVGTFLEWGLPKDLLVPFREQKGKMEAGKSYVVFVYFDKESKRLVASTKLEKYLDNLPVEYEEEQKVELLICDKTNLGYKAIIEDAHWGVIYGNEVFKTLNIGERFFGYIKKIRDDEKIDLSVYPVGQKKVEDFSETLMNYLKEHDGFLILTDRSSADEISGLFGVSKKTFKKATGNLYRQRLISLSESGIRLL